MSSLAKLFPRQAALPLDDPRQPDFDWSKQREIRMTIPPELAQEWVEKRNGRNRDFIENHAVKLGCDMLDGRWIYNGAPITFSRDGVLTDGQHRLAACSMSKVPLDALVVFGLNPDVILVTDIGKARTTGSQAKLYGVSAYNFASATARLLIAYDQHGAPKCFQGICQPTKTRTMEFVLEDWGDGKGPRRLQSASTATGTIGTRLGIPGSILGMCHVLFSRQSETRADIFYEHLSSGTGIEKDNPIYHFRERMIANKGAKAKLQRKEIVALIFKAWVFYRDGKKCRALRWQDKTEDFPAI